MKEATLKMMDEMVEFAREGNDIIPMFWQPARGVSNTVSAAIRCAVKRNLLVQDGVDGMGKPKYVAPTPQIPAPTHFGTAVMQ